MSSQTGRLPNAVRFKHRLTTRCGNRQLPVLPFTTCVIPVQVAWLWQGFDLPTVKVLMGHKDIGMTLQDTHLSSGYKQNAVKALDTFGTDL